MAKNVSKVTNFIEGDVSIRRSLARGFVNARALAKYIQEKLQLTCGIDAVISSIRRYSSKEETKEDIKQRYKIISAAKISSRTQMASVLLKKTKEVRQNISNLNEKIDFTKNSVLRILEVSQYIKVILDLANLPLVENIFDKKDIIDTDKKLGEINMIYNHDLKNSAGIFAAVSSELALNSISIQDSVICESECIIIVKQEDVVKSVQALYEVTKWGEKQ